MSLTAYRRRMIPPYWVSETRWACPNHVPGASYSASQEKCLYRPCRAERPAVPGAAVVPVVPAPRPVILTVLKPVGPPPPVKLSPDQKAVVLPASEYVRPVVMPPVSEGPSLSERERGATHPVACAHCGKTLWKRKKDAATGGPFFCNPEHRKLHGIVALVLAGAKSPVILHTPDESEPDVPEPAAQVKAVPIVRDNPVIVTRDGTELALVPVTVFEFEGPSPTERRRGATTAVSCGQCGLTLWRRKKDTTGGRVFLCKTHRAGPVE